MDADQPANDPATTGGSPSSDAEQDPALAVRSMHALINQAEARRQIHRSCAEQLHRKLKRAERLVTEVQCGLWPHRSNARTTRLDQE